LASEFARLPEEVKAKYENPQSHYSYGWSHGKERLKGIPDVFKGSYYNNPQIDVPTTDPAEIAATPEVSSANIWPTADLPKLEPAFKELGQLIVNVGTLLAHHCDKYIIEKIGDKYKAENYMENIIKHSTTAKARLLHYFEVVGTQQSPELDSWCGWHTDHSSITGLTSAIFRDVRTGEVITCPDPSAGLYVRLRNGPEITVKIPADCIAYQIGESSQILSGGILCATMHAVKGPDPTQFPYVTRDTFVVFMQPQITHNLTVPEGIPLEKVEVGQYKPGMNFGQFGKETINYYYN